MIALALVFAAVVVALAVLHARSLERLTQRHEQRLNSLVAYQQEDRDAWKRERTGMQAQFNTERLAWERERGVLLNRIKPETAQYVPQYPGDMPTMPAPVRYDDDEAFHDEIESREALAERLAEEELSGRTG